MHNRKLIGFVVLWVLLGFQALPAIGQSTQSPLEHIRFQYLTTNEGWLKIRWITSSKISKDLCGLAPGTDFAAMMGTLLKPTKKIRSRLACAITLFIPFAKTAWETYGLAPAADWFASISVPNNSGA